MSIYQHFRPEEKEFIDQVSNWQSYVESHYAPKLSDFLDPREQFIVQSIIGQNSECRVHFFGGTIDGDGERKRAFIYPEYLMPTKEDFSITLFEINYPDKFITIKHPEVLGSLMGLGLKRGKFGDILIQEKRVQFFVASEIAEYIRLHFHSVGKADVTLTELHLSKFIQLNNDLAEIPLTVSSLRLDTVLSTAGKISRQKAELLIQQGHVKVNWKKVDLHHFLYMRVI